MKNIRSMDQFARLLLGIALLQLAVFWLQGTGQIAAYGAAAVMLATAALRFCPIYRVLGIGSGPTGAPSMVWRAVAGLVLLAALAGGSYASVFFSKKFFLEDFNAMNVHYKMALFYTGKADRPVATGHYEKLVPAYQQFQAKYSAYQPYALRGDSQLQADLQNVAGMVKGVNELVRSGDLHQAHLDLEKVRPVFQELFKRNGFSMLSVALVDFHDAMELMLDAGNAKDAAKTAALYAPISEKLQAVEAEAQDAEIQAIRKNLDAMRDTAQQGQADKLPAQAEAYLQRG
jgi:Protein of unknown function (DUF2892)